MTTTQPISTPVSTTQFFQGSQGRLAYDDTGRGPLIVAAPGLGDLRQTYRFLIPLLTRAGYRVVTVDPRGQGESSARWPSYSPAVLGEDLLALIGHLNAGSAILIGNSYSGGAAAWAAAQEPALVSRLILIGAFVRDPSVTLLQRFMLAALLSGPWKVAGWLAYFKTLFKGGQPADFPTYLTRLRANLTEPGRFAALQAMLGESRAEVAARLADVQAPTLVVMGTADPDFKDPRAEAAFIADALHGETALLDGAGHYPQTEVPAATAEVIVRFLDGQRGA